MTIYRKDFPERDLTAANCIASAGGFNQQQRRERRSLRATYTAPELPFHADTTYGLAFRPKETGRGGIRQTITKVGDQVAITRKDQPFEGRSLYRTEFVAKPSEAPQTLQNLSALSYNCDRRPPSRVHQFVEHADHVFYKP